MNMLEKALRDASNDPAKQAVFYEVLSKSKIYFIPHGKTPETIDGRVIEGQKITIQNISSEDGHPYAPFFSSIDALQSFITEQVQYLETNAISFFEVIKGGEAALNPGSECGKIFLKQEILDILNGDINRKRSQITIEKETKVSVGRPEDYPNGLAEQLSTLYKGLTEVKAAHLAWVQMDAEGEKPHLLVMLTLANTNRRAFEKSGEIVNHWLNGRKEYVDFVDSNSGLAREIRSLGMQFYRKKIFGIF
jgi:hypothetical protein